MENNELLRQYLDKAESYCARSEHCAADVKRKLYEWKAPSELTDDIIDRLYDLDFLNDERFCRAYVHDKVEYQSWGRQKIQAGLRALQLPDRSIREAIDGIDEEVYAANLRKLVQQRLSDPEDKRLRFLLQRGFTYEEIKSATR